MGHAAGSAIHMIFECCEWLGLQTECVEEYDDGLVVEVLPILDRHNDYLRICIKSEGAYIPDTFTVSDDGYTVHELELQERTLPSEFADMREDNALVVRGSEKEIPAAFWRLLRAMMSV